MRIARLLRRRVAGSWRPERAAMFAIMSSVIESVQAILVNGYSLVD